MSGHTPGKWAQHPNDPGLVWTQWTDENGAECSAYVATVFGDDDTEAETEANVRLIAAAPELLDALRAVLASARPNPRDHPTMTPAWERGKAALAKAEGR